jgi:hypothetical protein
MTIIGAIPELLDTGRSTDLQLDRERLKHAQFCSFAFIMRRKRVDVHNPLTLQIQIHPYEVLVLTAVWRKSQDFWDGSPGSLIN